MLTDEQGRLLKPRLPQISTQSPVRASTTFKQLVGFPHEIVSLIRLILVALISLTVVFGIKV